MEDIFMFIIKEIYLRLLIFWYKYCEEFCNQLLANLETCLNTISSHCPPSRNKLVFFIYYPVEIVYYSMYIKFIDNVYCPHLNCLLFYLNYILIRTSLLSNIFPARFIISSCIVSMRK